MLINILVSDVLQRIIINLSVIVLSVPYKKKSDIRFLYLFIPIHIALLVNPRMKSLL